MHFALIISEDEVFFASDVRNQKPITQESAFNYCFEEYLQSRDGVACLPFYSWKFVSGESREAIEAGDYKLIVELHTHDSDGLWNLYKWVRSLSFATFAIKLDY